ncbi:MAG: prepilin-type N-terminal cleavage/methylation domain-containing protein [Desulfobacterium sp.]|nr:prepilin-type N-terminal cleavage/methylation domain-containing protein [Desulfobacterium sp.]
MRRNNWEKGFTLIELLLVVVIIGLMLSVIVPRAWRANIDAKYGLVRQNASELASFGQEWAENQLLAQNESVSTATIDDYLFTLSKRATAAGIWVNTAATWVADQANTNWSFSGAGGTAATASNLPGNIFVRGRTTSTVLSPTGQVPETTVEGIIPPEKVIRNPFNEVNVFQSPNDPLTAGSVVTGAILCGTISDDGAAGGVDQWHYYGFLFQGTDSTTNTVNQDTSFYSGMGISSLAGLRNGIFFARVRPGI